MKVLVMAVHDKDSQKSYRGFRYEISQSTLMIEVRDNGLHAKLLPQPGSYEVRGYENCDIPDDQITTALNRYYTTQQAQRT